MDSPKWCAYTVGEYPNEYAHFVYVPKLEHCKMFKLSIPLAPGNERRPDLIKDWTIRILIEDCAGLIYVPIPKLAKSYNGFVSFLMQTLESCNDKNTFQSYVSC